jgi:predicted extracellular nuclease/2',3'-cyclic-nucleotide 2'-phosphodiesterase (5'-nucleotidase family)
LPDMLTFTPDGSQILVANEGEPDGGIDPVGSVSIIDFNGTSVTNVATADFSGFDAATLQAAGVRLFPGKTPAEDLEPEYITVSGDTAFVTLQEANAVAVVDIPTATVTEVRSLGLKDYSQPGNELDASDRDGIAGKLQTEPVLGLYMPDAIASFTIDGQTYTITADEGDARDADARVSELTLDPTAFPDAATLQLDENLGRLEVSTIDGDTDGDGDYDQLVAYGGRSFTIRDAAGNIVFESGNQLEAIGFANADDPADLDGRSDNKGPEPEGVTVGVVNGRTLAFVGLERANGTAVYDVTNPAAPVFVQYLATSGDISPEGLEFIAAADSPTGQPLVVVANEVSNSLSVYSTAVPATVTPIYEIQGASHVSPWVLNGRTVANFFATLPAGAFNVTGDDVVTQGVVTAIDSNGFYIQDPNGDGDTATSDALFVFTGTNAPILQQLAVTQSVQVAGTVAEFFPGNTDTRNLPLTQLTNPTVTLLTESLGSVTATIIGQGGRVPPNQTIDDDAFATYEADADGIDFFESIEGMLVTAQNAVAVAGTNGFGEIFAVVDQGANATGLSQRGTLNISPDDFNPEKIQIDEDTGILPGFSLPQVDVGALLGDVTGVISYDFGNFQIHPTQPFSVVADASLTPETTTLGGNPDQLTVASYNVLNLDPNDDPGETQADQDIADGRFAAIAQQIVNNLNTPDIIGLQEIQDNSGGTDDGTVAADVTLQTLVDAIAAAGGPTYAFIDNPFITDGASGGQPGGNIRTAFLYNPERVSVDPSSIQTIGGQGTGEAFAGARLPLVADFVFNGQTVTIVNNHFSSKGGSAPILGIEQDFAARQEDVTVNGSLDERQAQSQAVQDFVNGLLASNPNANVVTLGDLNEFEFVSPVTGLETAGLTNLVNTLPADERYSFIFQGNSQSLDHILVSDNLLAGAAVDVVHVNTEFAETDQQASDHDPVLASFALSSEPSTFTLELLHVADQEAGARAVEDAPRFSAVLNALRAQDIGNDGLPDNTLTLSSGDAFIPGLFYDASAAVFGSKGIADIQIQNELGIQAIAFGNHEFDFGTAVLAGLIDGSAPGDFSALVGSTLEGQDFTGTAFPYLSTNLDFSTDANLAPLEVAGGQAPLPNVVTSSTVIDVNGENIGVVGATTPTLDIISSPGGVGIAPADFDTSPTPAQLDALAAEIQTEVDALLAANPDMNKVVLLAHMQQLDIERALAERLVNVDIIVGGGSNTRLFDNNDRPRPGDSIQGEYPEFIENAGGTQTALVNTDGSYKYVGRLVIDFDADGNLIRDSYDETVSGAYATDAQGVADLNAEGLVDPEIQAIADAIQAQIIATESNVFGISNVFLNGNRSGVDTPDDPDGVRTQETNLGNLTADANLAIAKTFDDSVVVSIKNGGGIRASIGQTIVPPGGTEAERLPNEAVVDSQGNVVKPEGGISQNDIQTTLAFNNGLTLLTLTKAELVAVLEHGVAAIPSVAGQFPQISGVKFSYDSDLPAGDRILNAGIFDENDTLIAELVRNGELVGDSAETFRIVTLNFLAGGGDGYPFPMGPDANRVDLYDLDADGVADGSLTGDAMFAADGTEQDALAEYLFDNFNTEATAFDEADTGRHLDERIQNLNFRADTIFASVVNLIEGTSGRDMLMGTDGDDILIGFGNRDTLSGGLGRDQFKYTSPVDGGDRITDFEVGIDVIDMRDLLDSIGYAGASPFVEGYIGVTSSRGNTVITVDSDGLAGSGRPVGFITVDNVSVAQLDNEANFLV